MKTNHLDSLITQDKLYDQDFCLWIETTIKQIEAQQFDKRENVLNYNCLP